MKRCVAALIAARVVGVPLDLQMKRCVAALIAARVVGVPLDLRLPAGDAAVFVPATVEGNAVLVPYFESLGVDDSFGAFLLTLGLGSLPGLRDEARGILARRRDEALFRELEAVVEAHASEPRPPLRAALPVLVDDRAFLVEWRGDADAGAAARAFVDRASEAVSLNASVATAVAGAVADQLNVRGRAREAQRAAFAAPSPLARDARAPDVAASPEGRPPPRRLSAFETVARRMATRRELPTFVLNLWSSTHRRDFSRRQLAAAGLLDAATWIPGADGVSLTPNVLVQAVAQGTVLSQGEVGIFLSHLTAWRDVVERGVPYALVLEDDAHLAADAAAVVSRAILDLQDAGEPWDLLALDFGLPGHVDAVAAEEVRRGGVHARCHAAAVDAARRGESYLRLDGGCAHASIGGMVVSHRGARRLLDGAAPVACPADTWVLRRVQVGTLDAFAALPAVAHVEAYGTTDSVRRYLTLDGPEVHWTFRADAELTCRDAPCAITIRV